jgi:GT2 family glycosyltransferase
MPGENSMNNEMREVDAGTKASEVCALVVTYNRLDLLKECVTALQQQTTPAARILIVNNGSTDDTAGWLDEQTDLWVIHQENLGGAGGFYRGVKEAFDAGYEAVWLMDDDVIPDSDALEKLCKAWARVPGAGFLASRVIGVNGMPLNVPTIDTRPLPNGTTRWPELADYGMLALKSATFVSVLFPRGSIEREGFPIAEMFIWGDDIEYTTRMSRENPSYWVLDSRVVHKRASQMQLNVVNEMNPSRIRMFYYHYRNRLYIALRYRDVMLLISHLVTSAKHTLSSLTAPHGFTRVRAIVGGLFAGVQFWRAH